MLPEKDVVLDTTLNSSFIKNMYQKLTEDEILHSHNVNQSHVYSTCVYSLCTIS